MRQAPRELWLVLAMKFTEGFALFSGLYILVKYLSEELGFSDVQAGWIFAWSHGLQLPCGLVLSTALDAFGVRRMCLAGQVLLFMARLVLWQVRSPWVVVAALLTIFPLGSAALFPALVVGVKRYSTPASRSHAFGVFYVLMNVASLSVAASIFLIREYHGPGLYSLVLGLGCASTLLGLVLSVLLRDPEPSEAEEEAQAPASAQRSGVMETIGSMTFLRFVAVLFCFVMIRLIFGHLKATVPKWMTREFGEGTPYELYIGLNAALVIVLVPVFTSAWEVLRPTTPVVLLTGASLSGFSPFWLVALPPGITGVILFVVTFSIGEAIWSPRLYEYTVSVPREGREGLYVACASAQLYLSKFLAGVSSGYLLHAYCPAPDGIKSGCQTRSLWLAISCTTAATPVLLGVFRSVLFPKSPEGNDDPERAAFLAK